MNTPCKVFKTKYLAMPEIDSKSCGTKYVIWEFAKILEKCV